MPHITVCSDLKGQTIASSFGELHFDSNGEAKLDPDLARQVLKKYAPTFWSKKKGKPDPEEMEVDEPVKAGKKGDKAPPADDTNFGFPANVHVSKAARTAMANGNLTADEIISERQKALSVTDVPKTTLEEDLIKGGGAAADKAGTAMKVAKVVDISSTKNSKSSKSSKDSGKKGSKHR